MRRASFERFYFEKVALGEGCGCAEHVTRMRDLEQMAARRRSISVFRRVIPAFWRQVTGAVLHLLARRRDAEN